VKLGNELTVEQQKATRLQPEPPRPPTEIDNARAMLGFFSDLKTSFPAPETPVSTPAAVYRENELRIDIARMEMEERNLIRGEVLELQQAERQAELVKEVGGYVSKGLAGFLKVLQETKSAEPARVRAPALNPKAPALEGGSPGKFPAMIQSSPGVWTRPSPEVLPEIEADVILQPPDRPGGTWIASADAETGEVISWAWAADPPPETVRERLQRVGLKAAGQNSPKSDTDSIQRRKTYLKSS